MDSPISPFEKWRLETIPQVGFTPEIRELLAMAFEGGRQSVAENQEPVAWMEEYQSCKVNGDERLCHSDKVFRLVQLLASQSKEWQSLSDDEIASVIKTTFPVNIGVTNVDLKFARAIEQASRKKNYG